MFHVRRRPADSQPRKRKKKPLGVSNGSNNMSIEREGPMLVEVTHTGDGGRRVKLGAEPIEVSTTGNSIETYYFITVLLITDISTATHGDTERQRRPSFIQKKTEAESPISSRNVSLQCSDFHNLIGAKALHAVSTSIDTGLFCCCSESIPLLLYLVLATLRAPTIVEWENLCAFRCAGCRYEVGYRTTDVTSPSLFADAANATNQSIQCERQSIQTVSRVCTPNLWLCIRPKIQNATF